MRLRLAQDVANVSGIRVRLFTLQRQRVGLYQNASLCAVRVFWPFFVLVLVSELRLLEFVVSAPYLDNIGQGSICSDDHEDEPDPEEK